MTSITLTEDQEKAKNAFSAFLIDPIETVFVLEGYSGTGKSTLVKELISYLPKIHKTAKLINPQYRPLPVQLTATTNKAAESLSQLAQQPVDTIHSFLGLRVQTDFRSGETSLIPSKNSFKEGYILFIDEASYIDRKLLDYIFKLTRNCKIIFMGDPAQLTPVKSNGVPVFDAKFSGAKLERVVRQPEGNPIIELSTKFRNTVNSGEFFSFKPDGHYIQYMDRDTFNEKIKEEFTRADWAYKDSKVLAWTNKRVIEFNHMIRDLVKGDPNFQIGDYAVCNKFITVGRQSLKTDQLVCITGIGQEYEEFGGVKGRDIQLDNSIRIFMPNSLAEKNKFIKWARSCGEYHMADVAENHWIDLRAAYASTVNKAQGSTYDRVFIDLDDISRCNSGNQIARMLYVAVSRARHQVFLTGDLV